jgi:hypothetical protein
MLGRRGDVLYWVACAFAAVLGCVAVLAAIANEGAERYFASWFIRHGL